MFEICKSHRLSSYKNILKTENRRIAVQMSSSWKWPMTDFEHELDILWTELSDGKQFLSSRFAHFFFTLKQNHFIVVVIESNIVQLFFLLDFNEVWPTCVALLTQWKTKMASSFSETRTKIQRCKVKALIIAMTKKSQYCPGEQQEKTI